MCLRLNAAPPPRFPRRRSDLCRVVKYFHKSAARPRLFSHRPDGFLSLDAHEETAAVGDYSLSPVCDNQDWGKEHFTVFLLNIFSVFVADKHLQSFSFFHVTEPGCLFQTFVHFYDLNSLKTLAFLFLLFFKMKAASASWKQLNVQTFIICQPSCVYYLSWTPVEQPCSSQHVFSPLVAFSTSNADCVLRLTLTLCDIIRGPVCIARVRWGAQFRPSVASRGSKGRTLPLHWGLQFTNQHISLPVRW